MTMMASVSGLMSLPLNSMARSVIWPVTMPLISHHSAVDGQLELQGGYHGARTVNEFTIDDALLTVGETATVDLEFSEPVTLFAAADITAPNGALSTMTTSNNVTWTGTFTPTANREVASNTLSLSTSWTDLAGNNGPAADATPNYEVDTQAPSGTFSFTDYLFQSDEPLRR